MSLPSWWLAAASPPAEPPAADLWQVLDTALDLAQSRPARAEGVIARELRDRAGPYYVLKQPEAGTYVRLSPREYWVWQRLDGTTTLQELVVAYFLEHGTFAFALIRGLVHHLYHKRMLRDQPQDVFADVREALARRTLAYRLTQPAWAGCDRHAPAPGRRLADLLPGRASSVSVREPDRPVPLHAHGRRRALRPPRRERADRRGRALGGGRPATDHSRTRARAHDQALWPRGAAG
ncbi:MAG: cyclic nucleotide-binding protein [Anaerolineales bacterium]|nr:cyclic nucleotide-binding protein [Anaerolineales bacterium]